MTVSKSIQNLLTACSLWMGGLRVLPAHLLWAVFVVSFVACGDEDIVPQTTQEAAICFGGSEQEAEAQTRAAAPLNHDFTVWGYKTVDGAHQLVFSGYAVTLRYDDDDDALRYEYVDETQTIKYWDFGASEYNFWGATGGNFADQGTTLTIDDLTLTAGEPVSAVMFSSLYHRSPVSSEVVQLEFKRPYAKVRVVFYTGATLTDKSFDNIKITGITFGPESPEQIASSGSLTVSYPKTGKGPETYSTIPTAMAGNLTFGDVELNHGQGTSSSNAVTAVPTGGSEYYFVVPNNNAAPFTLSAKIDNEDKTAVVPAGFMDWLPNYVYTYIFKISGGKNMEFCDVQIEPWHYGGAQEEEWKNW